MTHSIKLGPAGNCDKDILSSLKRLKNDLHLQAQEVAFVFGVTMGEEKARAAGELRKKLGLDLSIHAPYYINLSNEDPAKLRKSHNWILSSAERAHQLGASKIVFHPGFYQKREKDYVFDLVFDSIKELQKEIKDNGWKGVKLAPEVTGKLSAFGDLDEIVKLAKKAKSSFCIDFAHIYARQQGKIDYGKVLDKLKGFKHIHAHFSCIHYTDKGERNHLVLAEKEPDFLPLAKEIMKRKLDITIICESPVTWEDSLVMKKVFEKLGYKFS